jgi:molybdopterin synthase catalytic subunit
MEPPAGPDWIALLPRALPFDAIHAWATVPNAGAVVAFSGVVRDHAAGRDDVVAMTYEAYATEAERVLGEIAADLRRRWPTVARVALLHRVGHLAVGETSVLVVVSSPHRAEAFAAAEYGIDAIKHSAPIWKQEHWAGGTDWALGATPVEPVGAQSTARGI